MTKSVFYSANPPRKLQGGFNAHLSALMRADDAERVPTMRNFIDAKRETRMQDAFDRFGEPHDVLSALLDPFGFSHHNKDAVERAMNASRAMEDVWKTPARGIFMPFPGLTRRDLNTTVFNEGGALIADQVDARIVEALLPNSFAFSAGAKLISGLVGGDLIIGRNAGGPDVFWISDGDPAGDGNPQYDRVTITPHTLCTKVVSTLSLQKALSANGTNALYDMISEEIRAGMMAELDRIILVGTGIDPEPKGVLWSSGVNVVDAGVDGAAPSWDLLTEMEYQIAQPFSGNSLSWALSPRTRRKLRRTQRAAGLDFLWSDGAPPLGHSAGVTSALPDNLSKGAGAGLSAAILGDFSQVVVTLWGPRAIDLVVDAYTLRTSGRLQITAFMDVGIGIRHPEAFAVCKDLVTAA